MGFGSQWNDGERPARYGHVKSQRSGHSLSALASTGGSFVVFCGLSVSWSAPFLILTHSAPAGEPLPQLFRDERHDRVDQLQPIVDAEVQAGLRDATRLVRSRARTALGTFSQTAQIGRQARRVCGTMGGVHADRSGGPGVEGLPVYAKKFNNLAGYTSIKQAKGGTYGLRPSSRNIRDTCFRKRKKSAEAYADRDKRKNKPPTGSRYILWGSQTLREKGCWGGGKEKESTAGRLRPSSVVQSRQEMMVPKIEGAPWQQWGTLACTGHPHARVTCRRRYLSSRTKPTAAEQRFCLALSKHNSG